MTLYFYCDNCHNECEKQNNRRLNLCDLCRAERYQNRRN